MLFLLIFKTPSLPNRMSSGILRECSPPFMCHMSHVMWPIFSLLFQSSFILDKLVELVGGESVINGAYPVYLVWTELDQETSIAIAHSYWYNIIHAFVSILLSTYFCDKWVNFHLFLVENRTCLFLETIGDMDDMVNVGDMGDMDMGSLGFFWFHLGGWIRQCPSINLQKWRFQSNFRKKNCFTIFLKKIWKILISVVYLYGPFITKHEIHKNTNVASGI